MKKIRNAEKRSISPNEDDQSSFNEDAQVSDGLPDYDTILDAEKQKISSLYPYLLASSSSKEEKDTAAEDESEEGKDQQQTMNNEGEKKKRSSTGKKNFFFSPSSLPYAGRQRLPSPTYLFPGRNILSSRQGFKMNGRKRALSFFAHWRPVEHNQGQVLGMENSIGSSNGLHLSDINPNFVPPISSRGNQIQSRITHPTLLRWG